VTNEQAIKILVGNRNFYERIVRPYDHEMVEALNMAIKALEERPTDRWIPVSERLPEIATRCIVQLSNGYVTIGEYYSIEKWTIIETALQYVYPKETVTAWMPLPQPYKEGEEK
jgi:hypothetical protein